MIEREREMEECISVYPYKYISAMRVLYVASQCISRRPSIEARNLPGPKFSAFPPGAVMLPRPSGRKMRVVLSASVSMIVPSLFSCTVRPPTNDLILVPFAFVWIFPPASSTATETPEGRYVVRAPLGRITTRVPVSVENDGSRREEM